MVDIYLDASLPENLQLEIFVIFLEQGVFNGFDT